ncbi:MAG: 1,4-dihydroxy-2-naphthoate polyprenyltransferase [Myxococcota bacterium]|jgi:1,4-dihydroxy-2-naphthoate octaprenyltransferase|nr:1,4-dihydroxy-2-naphthoate polyprenyltransferase [Myxococcota bacterium]
MTAAAPTASSTRAPNVAPGSLRAWVLAARPQTLSAAFVPVAVGTAVAHVAGGVVWLPALAALLGAFLLQIGTNFANDVFDHEKGADTEARLGPTRAASSGLLTPRALYVGMIVSFGLALAVGVYLIAVAGWPILAIGIASILSGIAYTGGPYPLGYHGLGDVFVMIFFGFVAVCGTAYVQLDAVPRDAWIASVPVGALATAILVVNNVRDRVTDVHAGKRTLAVRFGRRAGEAEYLLLLVASYAAPIALAVLHRSPWPLLPLLSLPIGIRLFRDLRRLEGAPLNATLAGTAKLLLLHGVLLAGGLVGAAA